MGEDAGRKVRKLGCGQTMKGTVFCAKGFRLDPAENDIVRLAKLRVPVLPL